MQIDVIIKGCKLLNILPRLPRLRIVSPENKEGHLFALSRMASMIKDSINLNLSREVCCGNSNWRLGIRVLNEELAKAMDIGIMEIVVGQVKC